MIQLGVKCLYADWLHYSWGYKYTHTHDAIKNQSSVIPISLPYF